MGEGQESRRQGSKREPDGSLFDDSSDPQTSDDNDEDLTLSLDSVSSDTHSRFDQDDDPTLLLDRASLAAEGIDDGANTPPSEDDLTLQLPGWREPPTGEIPRVIEELAGEPLPPMHGKAPGDFDAFEDEKPIPVRNRRLDQHDDSDDFLIPVERVDLDQETVDAIRSGLGRSAPVGQDAATGLGGADKHDQDQTYIDVLQAALDERRGSPRRRVREPSGSSDSETNNSEPNGSETGGTGSNDAGSNDAGSNDAGSNDAAGFIDPPTIASDTPAQRNDDPVDTSDSDSRPEEPSIEDTPRRRSRHEVVSSRNRSQKRTRGATGSSRSGVKPEEEEKPSKLGDQEGRTIYAGGPTERVKAVRTLTGIVLAIVLLVALKLGTVSTLVVVVVAVTTAAAEGYNLLRRGGYRPAALVGLLAVIALVVGAYLSGEDAIVLVIVLTILVTLIWFMVQHRGEQFVAGVTTTMVMVVWVGLFGSFAGLMLRHSLFGAGGLGLLVGTLLCATMADVFAFFGGSVFGKHKLAPLISPGKTVEGVLIGGLATVLIGVLVLPHIHPFTLSSGLLIGLAVAIVAPIGDLAESALKRSVSAKDSSRLLPGHGGMLDRIDGILIVLPVAFYLFLSLHLR